MASAAIQALRRTVTVAWRQDQAAGAKAALLRAARSGHAEIMQRQGQPSFTVYANRPGNTNLDSVVLPGPIVYTYVNLKEIVAFALAELVKASPRRSEHNSYADSHVVFVNGQYDVADLDSAKPSDEVMITNLVPYARKIEIGKTKSGRDFVIQVPNKIYQRVARKVRQRYGRIVAVKFDYTTIPYGEVYQKTNRKRSWLKNKKAWRSSFAADRLKGMALRYPCIVISQLA